MTATKRHYSVFDQLLLQVDRSLRAIVGKSAMGERAYPGENETPVTLSTEQRALAASLMRVNQAGEVCAQALYQGQALTARSAAVRSKLRHAAEEETEHLAWCERRLYELNSHVSYFNPLWYSGSLLLGIIAGIAGDRWSLGFLAATEHQVAEHLTEHLQRLPAEDHTSRNIVQQMRTDEQQHAITAEDAGAAVLPSSLQTLMAMAAKVMTRTAYWV